MAAINGAGAQAGEQIPPGKPMSMEQHMLDEGAQMLQSLKPIKDMNQHVCTFALYSHDMSRQIETHHYVTRVNQDFLQCAVYDTDDSTGHLIGVEYIVSDRIFETLPPDEQKLWHTHAYEIKSGLWVNPRVPEMVVRPELENLAKTYGKFWCTWQTDRGDKLPMGSPALMMSPQGAGIGVVNPVRVQKRDDKYNISSDALKTARVEIAEPEWLNPQADYWKQHHDKGFSIEVETTEMKKGHHSLEENVTSLTVLPGINDFGGVGTQNARFIWCLIFYASVVCLVNFEVAVYLVRGMGLL